MNFSSARNSLKSFAHLLGNTSAAKGKKIEDDEEDETMNHEDVPAEDKEPLFDAVDTVQDTLRIFADMVPHIEVQRCCHE